MLDDLVNRCRSCPVPAGSPCLGATTHPAFCSWAATGEKAKVAHVVARSAIASGTHPTLVEMAGTLTGAVARFVAGGMKRTTPEERAARLATCTTCEFYTAKGKCRKCGCKLKYKLMIASEACPLGKWTAISPTTPAP